MKTRSGIKRGNPKRRAKLFKKQFHSKEFVEWTKKQECATPKLCSICNGSGTVPAFPGGNPSFEPGWSSQHLMLCPRHAQPQCSFEIEASHAKSRGAGGTWQDVFPQCSSCHAEMHRVGVVTFAKSRGKDPEWLHELAKKHADQWRAQ